MKYKPKHMKSQWGRKLGRALIFLAVAAVLAWHVMEPRMITVDTRTITDSDFSDDIRRLRIVYLTDVHMSAFPWFTERQVNAAIQRVNSLNPDLVLLGGDYATDTVSATRFFRNMIDGTFTQFRATYGVWAVLGQSDTAGGEQEQVDELTRTISAAGITLLRNSTASVRIGNATVYISGLAPGAGREEIQVLSKQRQQSDFVILLGHDPVVIQEAMKAPDAGGAQGWFDLGLFGKTHGGQLALFGKLLNLSNVEDRYQHGWLTENRIPLLTSNGLGTSGVPLRFLRPPQIHLIQILSK